MFYKLLVVLCIPQIRIYSTSTTYVKIDKDHLYVEPDCGKIPLSAKSRIANASPSKDSHPWYINVKRLGRNNVAFKSCGGALITRR